MYSGKREGEGDYMGRSRNYDVEQMAVTTIRTLAIDAIDKANSGHPGMPMGAAPMAYQLWAHRMKHYGGNPSWIDRDRFVLSAGHGSMLLYGLLHLFGYGLPMEELRNFRQWGSLTPGHPEYGHTPGVDATTGPLGQGFGMAVGMAIAEAHLAAVYNRPGFQLIDHRTYAICGDGDMMEGITGEAASLAGHLKLGKLIVLYDSNDISLDGDLSMSFSENVLLRFSAYGWHVQRVGDGNDLQAIDAAIAAAQADPRPSLIEVKTIIGYGSPNKSGKAGEHGSHGVPLGKEETKRTKRFYGWPEDREFYVPEEVAGHFDRFRRKGQETEAEWTKRFQAYRLAYPELAAQLEMAMNGQLPAGWEADLPMYLPEDGPIATRMASEHALNAIARRIPYIIGGSADLETSTKAAIKHAGRLTAEDYGQRNVMFGVREFAMGAAVNGMLLHRGVRAFAATFFVFSDYVRPAIRLAAIMKLPAIFVFTHDSIAVGEDGPTHEPIEQLASLRCLPGITVLRPADANETSCAWHFAMRNDSGPTVLVLTRQALPILPGTRKKAADGVNRGAYVLSDVSTGRPHAQIIATGSEVQLAMAAQQLLMKEGIYVRVISMPSWELFEKQTLSYRNTVIDPEVEENLAVEMGSPQGWHYYIGKKGAVLAINRFGASAPAARVIQEYGFTADHVAERVRALLKK